MLLLLGSLYASSMDSTVSTSTSLFGVHVTKVMPIQFIDGNKLKSYRRGLTNYTGPMSHHITPLVINALRANTQIDR